MVKFSTFQRGEWIVSLNTRYDIYLSYTTKGRMDLYSVSPTTKVKGNKGGHFNVRGTILN
jgi:hypothetical protein